MNLTIEIEFHTDLHGLQLLGKGDFPPTEDMYNVSMSLCKGNKTLIDTGKSYDNNRMRVRSPHYKLDIDTNLHPWQLEEQPMCPCPLDSRPCRGWLPYK